MRFIPPTAALAALFLCSTASPAAESAAGIIPVDREREEFTLVLVPDTQRYANQQLESGGDGWLRLLKFMPGEKRLLVRTYSPWLKKFHDDPRHSFELALEPGF